MQTVELVQYLRDGASVSANALARTFNASVRTVRAHIHEANASLDGVAAIVFSRASRGYRLRVDDERALSAWLERNAALAGAASKSASEERAASLLSNLLARTDWVTIGELAEMLYVSPQSISGDLKRVEEQIGRFGLELVKRPRYGVRVEGSEMARRLCLASAMSEDALRFGSLWGQGGDAARVYERVERAVEDVVREVSFSISAMAFQNLVVHMVVALARIRANAFMPMDEERLSTIRVSEEFPLAQRIAHAIEQGEHIEIPESEVAYIAIHLAGKRTLDALASSPSGNGTVISEEIWTIVDDMLKRVWESFRFDFRGDLELHMNLARHLVPLVARLEYHLRVENPLLQDIKMRYPLAYSMGVEAASVLAERYARALSEEEVGYLALAFALALDRLKGAAPKKNILLVCATGAGTTRLLKRSITGQFGERIGKVRVCDALHVADQDFADIDYVFTTVPLAGPVPVPVQEIGCFLDAGDVRSISAIIDRAPHERDFLERLFSPELFFARLACADRAQVLETLSRRVVETTDADERLCELVRERERAASTAFGNRIALPHPIRPITEATCVCVALLDRPVSWGGSEVELVMLVAIGTEDPEALDFFFSGAASLLSDSASVDRILAERTFEAFIDAFVSSAHNDRS